MRPTAIRTCLFALPLAATIMLAATTANTDPRYPGPIKGPGHTITKEFLQQLTPKNPNPNPNPYGFGPDNPNPAGSGPGDPNFDNLIEQLGRGSPLTGPGATSPGENAVDNAISNLDQSTVPTYTDRFSDVPGFGGPMDTANAIGLLLYDQDLTGLLGIPSAPGGDRLVSIESGRSAGCATTNSCAPKIVITPPPDCSASTCNQTNGAGTDPILTDPQFGVLRGINRIPWNEVSIPVPGTPGRGSGEDSPSQLIFDEIGPSLEGQTEWVVTNPSRRIFQDPAVGSAAGDNPGVNGTHMVQSGETLFRIALRYGVTMSELAAANDIPDVSAPLFSGQSLVLPTTFNIQNIPATTPQLGGITYVNKTVGKTPGGIPIIVPEPQVNGAKIKATHGTQNGLVGETVHIVEDVNGKIYAIGGGSGHNYGEMRESSGSGKYGLGKIFKFKSGTPIPLPPAPTQGSANVQ